MISQSEKDILWEKHRPYVEILSQVNNSYVSVTEWRIKCLYVSPNFGDFFDYVSDYNLKTIEEQVEIIDASIHPDDLAAVINFQDRVFDYIFSLPFEERKDYKHIFEFRVMGPSRKYLRIIFQYHILEGAETKDYVLLLFVADISPEQGLDEPVKFKLVNFKTNEVVKFPLFEEKTWH